MILTKEEMALEALIKIMVCIRQSGTTINESAIDYANDALNANGWGIGVNDFGMCRPVKIDAQTPNPSSN